MPEPNKPRKVRVVFDEMIELIIAAHLAMSDDTKDYFMAAHLVIQAGVGVYAERPDTRKEWARQLYAAAKSHCNCKDISSISCGVRPDRDMEALEKITRCFAHLAREVALARSVRSGRV